MALLLLALIAFVALAGPGDADVPVAAAARAARTATATPAPLACAVQRATLRLCGARTDNYKDCYNTPDGRTEARSWLSYGQLVANGARYRKQLGTPQFGSAVWVTRIRGNRRMPREAYVTVRALSGNVKLLNLRSGPPDNLWGPLLEMGDPSSLSGAPVRMELQLRNEGGSVLARAPVSYRRDEGLASAAAASPEHQGPGGRWYVGGRRTSTDVELGAVHVCS